MLSVRTALHLLHHQPIWRCRLHHHHDAAPGLCHSSLLFSLRPLRHHRRGLRRRRGFYRAFPAGLRAQPYEIEPAVVTAAEGVALRRCTKLRSTTTFSVVLFVFLLVFISFMLLLWMVCFAFIDIGTKKGVLTVTDAPKGPTQSAASSAYIVF